MLLAHRGKTLSGRISVQITCRVAALSGERARVLAEERGAEMRSAILRESAGVFFQDRYPVRELVARPSAAGELAAQARTATDVIDR